MWTPDLFDSSSGPRSPAVQLDGNSGVFNPAGDPRKRGHNCHFRKKHFQMMEKKSLRLF